MKQKIFGVMKKNPKPGTTIKLNLKDMEGFTAEKTTLTLHMTQSQVNDMATRLLKLLGI